MGYLEIKKELMKMHPTFVPVLLGVFGKRMLIEKLVATIEKIDLSGTPGGCNHIGPRQHTCIEHVREEKTMGKKISNPPPPINAVKPPPPPAPPRKKTRSVHCSVEFDMDREIMRIRKERE
ncbi:MAG: hypothetical protein KAR42_15295 [candidate division Zixibacteria bacterium]|nr:hypothetical protein [candidate division Zixibacteria bacterium]